jgi:cell division septum initiation protein DivIVA
LVSHLQKPINLKTENQQLKQHVTALQNEIAAHKEAIGTQSIAVRALKDSNDNAMKEKAKVASGHHQEVERQKKKIINLERDKAIQLKKINDQAREIEALQAAAGTLLNRFAEPSGSVADENPHHI